MKKILICQTAHIGDVIATLPMAYVIKKNWPACHVTYLCQHYAAATCKLAKNIDEVLIWDELKELPMTAAVTKIKEQQFEAVIHVRSEPDISKIMYKAKIKIRIDQGRRFYKRIYSNRRQKSWRHNTNAHQAQCFLRLLNGLKLPNEFKRKELSSMIQLKKPTEAKKIEHYLDQKKFNLVLHPFSNKSGREWPLDHFFKLLTLLDIEKYHVIITGSADEGKRLQNTPLADTTKVTNLCGKTTLDELLNLLAHIDGLVVGSTGPLHIAAAFGRRCLGLFPTQKGMNIDRWQALGECATSITTEQICASGCSNQNCACMRALSAAYVKSFIDKWALEKFPCS